MLNTIGIYLTSKNNKNTLFDHFSVPIGHVSWVNC